MSVPDARNPPKVEEAVQFGYGVLMAWNDFFKLWRLSKEDPMATSGTGTIGNLPPPLVAGKGYSVILLVDDKTNHKMTSEAFRKADYVITKSGKYLKTRDGTHPVVLNDVSAPSKEKNKKYRSIDDQ